MTLTNPDRPDNKSCLPHDDPGRFELRSGMSQVVLPSVSPTSRKGPKGHIRPHSGHLPLQHHPNRHSHSRSTRGTRGLHTAEIEGAIGKNAYGPQEGSESSSDTSNDDDSTTTQSEGSESISSTSSSDDNDDDNDHGRKWGGKHKDANQTLKNEKLKQINISECEIDLNEIIQHIHSPHQAHRIHVPLLPCVSSLSASRQSHHNESRATRHVRPSQSSQSGFSGFSTSKSDPSNSNNSNNLYASSDRSASSSLSSSVQPHNSHASQNTPNPQLNHSGQALSSPLHTNSQHSQGDSKDNLNNPNNRADRGGELLSPTDELALFGEASEGSEKILNEGSEDEGLLSVDNTLSGEMVVKASVKMCSMCRLRPVSTVTLIYPITLITFIICIARITTQTTRIS